MPLKGSQLVLLGMLIPAEAVGSPGTTGSLFSTARDGHREEGDSSINEMHRRSSPGLLTMSSAGPIPPPGDTVTVAAMAAAVAAATSEPLLCCLWPPLLWEAVVLTAAAGAAGTAAAAALFCSSTSGASSNRRLNLCENPVVSGKDDALGVHPPPPADAGAAAVAEVAADAAVGQEEDEVWIGFKGCRAAALFGDGDQGVWVSAAPGKPAAGGLLEWASVLVVAEKAPPSIALEKELDVPPVDA